MKLKVLVGSGARIGLLTLPFLVIGLILNIRIPSLFAVGGPPMWLRVVSCIVLIPGIAIWVWTVALILIHVPKKELITTGPYSWVKHPLYTNIAFCVFPWVGFLCNTWLGIPLGIVVYIGSTLFSPREEAMLSKLFGKAWEDYVANVRIPWL